MNVLDNRKIIQVSSLSFSLIEVPVRRLASVPNVQVIKSRKSECRFHRDFVLYLSWILFNL